MIEHSPIKNFKKFKETQCFLDSIQSLGGIVCGGFARECYLGQDDFGDFDIYPIHTGNMDDIHEYLMEITGVKSRATKCRYNDVDAYNYRLTYKTITHLGGNIPLQYRFQLIDRPGWPEEIINDFDLSVCKAYLDIHGKRIYHTKEFKEHNEQKHFTIDKLNPSNTVENHVWRIIKYIEKGYTIYPHDLMKAISTFDEIRRNAFLDALELTILRMDEKDKNLEQVIQFFKLSV